MMLIIGATLLARAMKQTLKDELERINATKTPRLHDLTELSNRCRLIEVTIAMLGYAFVGLCMAEAAGVLLYVTLRL